MLFIDGQTPSQQHTENIHRICYRLLCLFKQITQNKNVLTNYNDNETEQRQTVKNAISLVRHNTGIITDEYKTASYPSATYFLISVIQ